MAKAKKFHVHCDLPNASNLINGIEFAPHENGGVRTVAPVDADVAEHFKSIRGYKLLAPGKADSAAVEVSPPAGESEENTDSDNEESQTSLLPE